MPLVSVICSVRDGERFLRAALESVLGQTLGDLELIVVDDGSTDRSAAVVRELGSRDRRVRLLTNEKNEGLSVSLNRALEVARGRYIARQDADDVSYPGRLAQQVATLRRCAAVGVLGCSYRVVDEGGRPLGVRWLARSPEELRWLGLFHSPVAHGSVMIDTCRVPRSELRYAEWLPLAQDFELWSRLSLYGGFSNTREILMDYRVHAGAVSVALRERQAECADLVARRNLESLGLHLSPAEVRARRFVQQPGSCLEMPDAEYRAAVRLMVSVMKSHWQRDGASRARLSRVFGAWGVRASYVAFRKALRPAPAGAGRFAPRE